MDNNTKKMRTIVLMANEMLQTVKTRDKTGLHSSFGRLCNENENYLSEAWIFATPYIKNRKRIKRIEPIIKVGRGGGYEGVKIINEEGML